MPTGVRVVDRIQDQFDFAGSLTDGHYLGYVSGTGKFTLSAITVPTGANPSASVGLTAVNGSAGTFLRSDGAPALDQAIAPTWTGRHVFSINGAVSAPPVSLTGTWYSGGSATTTKPQVLIEPTGTTSTGWSTSGTGIGVNAASGFAGNLLDLQVNGNRMLSVRDGGHDGILVIDAIGSNSQQITIIPRVNGITGFTSGEGAIIDTGSGGITIGANAVGGVGTTLRLGCFASPAYFIQNAVSTTCVVTTAIASRTAPLQKFQTSAAASLGNVSGGCVADVYADVATTSTDGTFDTLHTYTSPANALIANGDKIYFDYTLTLATHTTNTAEIKLTFAGITIFANTAYTVAAASTIRLFGYITRKSSTTCRATVSATVTSGVALTTLRGVEVYTPDSTLTGLTLTGTNNLVLSAASAGTGAASGDIALVQSAIHIDGFGS